MILCALVVHTDTLPFFFFFYALGNAVGAEDQEDEEEADLDVDALGKRSKRHRRKEAEAIPQGDASRHFHFTIPRRTKQPQKKTRRRPVQQLGQHGVGKQEWQ